MRRPLTEEDLVAVLDAWAEMAVVVRVVADDDELIAVFRGRLGRRTAAKHPALFWPLETPGTPPAPTQAEQPGVYLHPHLFSAARFHVGDTVVEWSQAGVEVNVRRE
jgi:hypothetical protein